MQEGKPEFELQEALDLFWDDPLNNPESDENETRGFVQVPCYVLEDAIERLKRYEIIVRNLTNAGNYLWAENLRKYGGRKIHEKETPFGAYKDETYKSMCAFVNNMTEIPTIDDVYVEIALSMSRISTGDPTGLMQYLEKEEKLFEQLDTGD